MPSNNWKYKPLNEVASRIMEKNGERTNNVLTISAQHGLVSQTEYFNKSVASKNLSGYYYLTKGDFAYNKSYSEGYPFGAIKQLEGYDHGVVSTLYICFRLNSALVDSRFYKQYFESGLWNSEVRNIAQEGGRSHGLLNVGVKEFFEIFVPVPSLEEQQKIASILSSVDEAIEKTEAIIEQTEKIKKGLMQQLFTKGIGHTKFKKTEIGEIPVGWDLLPVGSIAKLQGGYAFKSKDYIAEGIQLIRISNLFGKFLNLAKDPVYLPLSYKEDYGGYVLNEGDLIICMTGTVGKEDYGHVVKIPQGSKSLLLNQRVGRFIFQNQGVDRNFLFWFLSSRLFLDVIYSFGNGTKQANLSAKQIESVLIPFPPKEEQMKISRVLDSIDEKVEIEKERLYQLEVIKKGLMQSLFIGKVRVKVDETEVTQV